jgi:hypothetical protein
VTIEFMAGKQMNFSPGGGASGLVAEGTEGSPVVFTAHGVTTAGYWDGLIARSGVEAGSFRLENVEILYSGGDAGYRSALDMEDLTASLVNVTVSGSEQAGIRLRSGAHLTPGSTGNVVTDCDVPLYVTAAGLGSVQTAFADLTGNHEDYVHIGTDNNDPVDTSTTWGPLGVPYWVDDDIEIDGTDAGAAVLTIEPGTSFYMADETALFVSKGTGPGGLQAIGTAAEPIVFLPAESNTAGAWDGIGLYEDAVSASCNLQYIEVGYGGGTQLRGNLHFEGVSPTVNHASIHDSGEYGIYVARGAAPSLGADITYADNASGDTNG